MHESTRQAQLDDLEVVVEILEEGRAGIADARGGPLWLHRQAVAPPLPGPIGQAIDATDWLVQVAEIDDVPLGVLVGEVEVVHHQAVGVVREVYVTPGARGVGLGELLMDAMLDWSARNGCVGVDGYALPGDRATKNYFETFGLVARGIVVHRRLT
ncbi:MAG: GNAT family N-acetyltransferase [Acidimicrobiia bacterium]